MNVRGGVILDNLGEICNDLSTAAEKRKSLIRSTLLSDFFYVTVLWSLFSFNFERDV